MRLRKLVAFDRFLARIVNSDPDVRVLKGGLALQQFIEPILAGRASGTWDPSLWRWADP